MRGARERRLCDEFLSAEDLDLRSLSWDELLAYWNLWLHQAQVTNERDADLYSHGVFSREPPRPTAALDRRQRASE